jgi:hypothetical protein
VRRPFPFVWGLLLVTLPLGCAAQYEEPAGTQPDSAREQAVEPEAAAMDDEAPTAVRTEQSELGNLANRSLAEIELELASNEAKLRALGVELPSRAVAGELVPGPEPAQPGGGGTTSSAKADARPSTSPAPKPEPDSATKQGRRDKPAKQKKTETAVDADRFANPPPGEPEEAKATPLSPTEQPKLDAATRCIQVCELSEITCELGVQICELAQRHAGNEDYEQACARATDDCDAAQEACDVCAG